MTIRVHRRTIFKNQVAKFSCIGDGYGLPSTKIPLVVFQIAC